MNLIDTMERQDEKRRQKQYANHKVVYTCGCEVHKRVDTRNGKVINSRSLQCDKYTAKEWLNGKRCDRGRL